jgi:hypothetical protein
MFCAGVKFYNHSNNEYQYLQGTSMAANTAGVAALIRSIIQIDDS